MKLPRFTLRDLLWLVLVAAMGLGWWITFHQVEVRWIEDRRQYLMQAQFAIEGNLQAQGDVMRLRAEVQSLKERIHWLQTPEDERPVP